MDGPRDLGDEPSGPGEGRHRPAHMELNVGAYRALCYGISDPVLVSVVDHAEGRRTFREANESACRLLGYTREELLCLTPRDLSTAEAGPGLGELLHDLAPGETAVWEVVLLARDGTRVPVEVSASLLDLGGRWVAICLCRELAAEPGTATAAKQRAPAAPIAAVQARQAEALRAARLESAVEVAARVAHDLSDALTGIMGNVALARMEAGAESDVSLILADAEAACLQAREQVRQLMYLARSRAPIVRETDVALLLRELVTSIACPSTANIAERLPCVNADEAQLTQALRHLLDNACEATGPEGRVAVAATSVRLGPASDVPLDGGDYVRITVADNGPGVPAKHLVRVFDPYFTTKPGRSGLGLTVAYTIVRAHGGHIGLRSCPGAGTTVEVHLPACPAKP